MKEQNGLSGLAVTWDQFDSCGIIFHPKIFSRLYFPIKIFRPRPDRILFRRPWIAVCSGAHQGKTKGNIHINYVFKLFWDFSVSLSFISRLNSKDANIERRRSGETPWRYTRGGDKKLQSIWNWIFPPYFYFSLWWDNYLSG